jgi:hypothetical protein
MLISWPPNLQSPSLHLKLLWCILTSPNKLPCLHVLICSSLIALWPKQCNTCLSHQAARCIAFWSNAELACLSQSLNGFKSTFYNTCLFTA